MKDSIRLHWNFLKKVYHHKRPKHVVLDIDSTYINTYGNQEENAYNYHYNSKGYHPLKANNQLYQQSQHVEKAFYEAFGQDCLKTHAFYEDFTYKAGTWDKDRRVVCKIERKAGELYPRHTFIVTNLNSLPQRVIKAYQKRGNMENFIKEAKLDFGMGSLSHTSFLANAVKLRIKALAYNLINLMKRLILPKEQRKSRMLSLRNTFIKVASRHSRSSRYKKIRICSSYPYKKLFHSLLQKLALGDLRLIIGK